MNRRLWVGVSSRARKGFGPEIGRRERAPGHGLEHLIIYMELCDKRVGSRGWGFGPHLPVEETPSSPSRTP